MSKKYVTLVLGLGNDILMDDGIGPRLVNDLSRECSLAEIQYKSASVGGLELVELIQDYQQLVLIDAIKTENGVPGAVYFFNPDNFNETQNLSNIHDISFLQALKLAGILNIKVPQSIHIIAIEIKEDRIFGSEFTPELQSRYHDIKNQVKHFINSLSTSAVLKQ
jgi:hydrogenase maturation protease